MARRRIGIAGSLLALMQAGLPCIAEPLPTAAAERRAPLPTLSSRPSSSRLPGLMLDDLIAEAARRFGLPPGWIRAVMQQESGFNPQAVSRAGAMGLMQVMPGTYAELRRRYGLGPDPYDPRDNVMAGAAYLRELHDRFGLEGMLAAYNAGPGRYLQHRDEGRNLPAETRDYVARIGALEGGPGQPSGRRPAAVLPLDPARAPLFPVLSQTEGAETPDLFVALAVASEARPQ